MLGHASFVVTCMQPARDAGRPAGPHAGLSHALHRLTGLTLRQAPKPRVRPAGALGGRLDHTLANLNTLFRHAGPPLALLGEGNLVRLLRAGRSEIAIDRGLLGPACGLVALGAPATASSSGLRWDLGARRWP